MDRSRDMHRQHHGNAVCPRVFFIPYDGIIITLSVQDERSPTESYLFNLSRGDVLRHFRHVLLVSSAEVIKE